MKGNITACLKSEWNRNMVRSSLESSRISAAGCWRTGRTRTGFRDAATVARLCGARRHVTALINTGNNVQCFMSASATQHAAVDAPQSLALCRHHLVGAIVAAANGCRGFDTVA
jgi:hypothetical protein